MDAVADKRVTWRCVDQPQLNMMGQFTRAFAVKVAPKRLPVFPFSGLLKGCKGHQTHRFENGGTNQIRKMGKREVVLLQPLPQTLYCPLTSIWRRRVPSLQVMSLECGETASQK